MISKEKMNDLINRMKNHSVVSNIAVVVLTAKELQDLLETIQPGSTMKIDCKDYLNDLIDNRIVDE